MFKIRYQERILKLIPLVQILHNIFLINISYSPHVSKKIGCKPFILCGTAQVVLVHDIRSIAGTQNKYSKTALICYFKFNSQ